MWNAVTWLATDVGYTQATGYGNLIHVLVCICVYSVYISCCIIALLSEILDMLHCDTSLYVPLQQIFYKIPYDRFQEYDIYQHQTTPLCPMWKFYKTLSWWLLWEAIIKTSGVVNTCGICSTISITFVWC